MITKNFQKLGALVASLVSILTLSSAAEAITFSSTPLLRNVTAGSIGTPVTATATANYVPPVTTPGYIAKVLQLNSVTINGLTANPRNSLQATLSAPGSAAIQLFFSSALAMGSPSVLPLGDYTFTDASAAPTWASGINATYKSKNPLATLVNSNFNGDWKLSLTDLNDSSNSSVGSFTGFTVDATPTPVPFDSNAAPAGVAIVFGAFVLRRKLQQRSARMMSLESVNS